MTNDQRQAKLAAASALIQEVRESFSNDRTVCECCGFERFDNWNDRQMREQLSGAITRLERVGDRMNQPAPLRNRC